MAVNKTMDNAPSKVIAIRVSSETHRRLSLRATRLQKRIGSYIREWLEKDIYRCRDSKTPVSTAKPLESNPRTSGEVEK